MALGIGISGCYRRQNHYQHPSEVYRFEGLGFRVCMPTTMISVVAQTSLRYIVETPAYKNQVSRFLMIPHYSNRQRTPYKPIKTETL